MEADRPRLTDPQRELARRLLASVETRAGLLAQVLPPGDVPGEPAADRAMREAATLLTVVVREFRRACQSQDGGDLTGLLLTVGLWLAEVDKDRRPWVPAGAGDVGTN